MVCKQHLADREVGNTSCHGFINTACSTSTMTTSLSHGRQIQGGLYSYSFAELFNVRTEVNMQSIAVVSCRSVVYVVRARATSSFSSSPVFAAVQYADHLDPSHVLRVPKTLDDYQLNCSSNYPLNSYTV